MLSWIIQYLGFYTKMVSLAHICLLAASSAAELMDKSAQDSGCQVGKEFSRLYLYKALPRYTWWKLPLYFKTWIRTASWETQEKTCLRFTCKVYILKLKWLCFQQCWWSTAPIDWILPSFTSFASSSVLPFYIAERWIYIYSLPTHLWLTPLRSL